jgi:AcrR family transcriptional regulator
MTVETLAAPRKPRRAAGRARYEVLLNAAEAALDTQRIGSIGLQDIAERAECPLASVYHYFPNVSAVFVGLADRYRDLFLDVYRDPVDPATLGRWSDLVRIYSERSRQIYLRNPAAMQLLLGPEVGWQIRQSDIADNQRFACLQYDGLTFHFVVPPGDLVIQQIAISITISDAIWSLSYANSGTISEAMQSEALQARIAYLSLHIPPLAPRRGGAAALS